MGCGGSKDEVAPIAPTIVEEFVSVKDEDEEEREAKYMNVRKDILDEAWTVMQHIKESFNDMDLDENGYLSKEELKLGYTNEKYQISDEGIDYIMKHVDTNEDGQVSKG